MTKKYNKRKRKYYEIKEIKLVDTSRLRVVKDVHLNGWINPEKYEFKKSEMIEKISINKGVYPREESILVYRLKDPEDRRRVIYNIQDGFRRFKIANELSLDKIYVSILSDKK